MRKAQMARLAALALLSAFTAGALSACGERPQTAQYNHGKYRGKPDTQPWDNAPAAYGSPQWKPGDEASWDRRIRERAATQNEYDRIGY